MHIVFVAHEFVTERELCGGFGHYLANISEILAERGHRVTILLISNHNEKFQWKDMVDVIVFNYNAYKGPVSWFGMCADLLTKRNTSWYLNRSREINRRIRNINQEHKIDIIQYCGDDLSVWYRPKNITSVVRLSSFGPWYDLASQPETDMKDMRWLKTWESRFFLYSFMKADAVYGPSRAVTQIVEKKLKKEIRVIESPCIINDEVKTQCDAAELIGKKYLLFFGRICYLKGIGLIEEIIYDVLKDNPDFIFAFAGREVDKGLIRKIKKASAEYSDRAVYLGEFRDPDKLNSVVQNAYACVLPSRADNLPNSCIEAMGLGKVVIGTYGASFEQLIKHKKSGLLIKQDSSAALKKAIDYAMQMTNEERYDMGIRAKERIAQMHPDKIYEQLMSFYQEVMKDKQKRR